MIDISEIMHELIIEHPDIDGGIVHATLLDTLIDIEKKTRYLCNTRFDGMEINRAGTCRIPQFLYDEHLDLIKAGVDDKIYSKPVINRNNREARRLASDARNEYVRLLNMAIAEEAYGGRQM